LDDIENEYLVKKGVFDLPPRHNLDALVKTYFDHVHPFAPLINRADFIRRYQSGNCSLFLLHVILTPASLHAPADVLSACGFASRSAAQESFFSKAKVLHDFDAEDDPLLMLQGSTILSMVILDHPTDQDFGYWFHNAVRLATKLDLRNPQQDPRQMMQPLDKWRESLAAKMHLSGNTGSDIYYLNIQAMSYRFECILCRLIRRCFQQSGRTEWSEWAKQRLRTAILELDTIAMRILASGTLQDFPVPFVTTMTALLALHIESALDTAETDLVRSMARISISQTMLLLTQGKEIPALKRALPVFEEILAKNNLYMVPSPPNTRDHVQVSALSQPHSSSMTDAYGSTHTQSSVIPPQLEQPENNNPFFDVDFLGFDFLDDWQIGQVDFTG
ncbi:hypothetical protein KCU88_g1316, partial [Aureobasidium melanogenum]